MLLNLTVNVRPAVLQLFCSSPKAALRYAAVRTLNKVQQRSESLLYSAHVAVYQRKTLSLVYKMKYNMYSGTSGSLLISPPGGDEASLGGHGL